MSTFAPRRSQMSKVDSVAAPPTLAEGKQEVGAGRQFRRTFPRRPVRWNAIIYHKAREGGAPVVIRNLSRGGMMLENAFGLMDGDRVRVALMSGRLLEGRIVWTLAPYCGFKFDTALAGSDGLLFAK